MVPLYTATVVPFCSAVDTSLLAGEGELIDPKILAAQFDRLSNPVKEILFRGRQKEMGNLIRLLAARFNVVDTSTITKAGGTDDIFDLLKGAAFREIELRKDFDRNVFKRILAGELDAGQIAPENFVRFVLRTASFADMRKLFQLLPADLAESFRKRTIIDMLDRSALRSADAKEKIFAVTRDTPALGDKLLDIMARDFGDNVQDSLKKIRLILGDDTFKIIKDLGIVQASRARAEASGRAAGGLVAGSILSDLANLKLGSAMRIVKYRIVAGLLQFGPTNKWLTSGVKLKSRTARAQALIAVLPQVMRVVGGVVGEDSETMREIAAFFQGGRIKEILGLAK